MCFMVHIISDVHCSVDTTIGVLQTHFDASIPRPHCIVDSVFYVLKCGLKLLKNELKFWTSIQGMTYTEQHVSYTLDVRVNSDLSGQLYT
jgi:hypothetical protein